MDAHRSGRQEGTVLTSSPDPSTRPSIALPPGPAEPAARNTGSRPRTSTRRGIHRLVVSSPLFSALIQSGANYKTLLYPAEHAFMRDEGPRFDPEATDLAFADMIQLFRKVFSA